MYSEGGNSSGQQTEPDPDLLLALLADNSFDSFLRPGLPRHRPHPPPSDTPDSHRLLADAHRLDELLGLLGMERTSSEWKSSFQSVLSKFAAERGRPSELRLGGTDGRSQWFGSLPRATSSLLTESLPVSPPPEPLGLRKSSSGSDLRGNSATLEALRDLRAQASGITANLSMLEQALANAEAAKSPLPSPRPVTFPVLRENISASFNKTFASEEPGQSAFLAAKLEQLRRQKAASSSPGVQSPASPAVPPPTTLSPPQRGPLNFTEINAMMEQVGRAQNGESGSERLRKLRSEPSRQPAPYGSLDRQKPAKPDQFASLDRRQFPSQQRTAEFAERRFPVQEPRQFSMEQKDTEFAERRLGELQKPSLPDYNSLDRAKPRSVDYGRPEYGSLDRRAGKPKPVAFGPLDLDQIPTKPKPQLNFSSLDSAMDEPKGTYRKETKYESKASFRTEVKSLGSKEEEPKGPSEYESETQRMAANLLSEVDTFLVRAEAKLKPAKFPLREPKFPVESKVESAFHPRGQANVDPVYPEPAFHPRQAKVEPAYHPLPSSQPKAESAYRPRDYPTVEVSRGSASPERSVVGLPQPPPKHHLREQLASIGAEPRSPRLGPATAFPWALGSGSVAERVSKFERFPVVGSFTLQTAGEKTMTVIRTRPNVVEKGLALPMSLTPSPTPTPPAQSPTPEPILLQPIPGRKGSGISTSSAPTPEENGKPVAPSPTPQSPTPNKGFASAKVVLSPRNAVVESPRKESPRPPPSRRAPSVQPGSASRLPRFHFPAGKPAGADVEAALGRLAALPAKQLRLTQMPEVVKALGLPLYWKRPVFLAAGGAKGHVTLAELASWWRSLCGSFHDEAARFVATLKGGRLAPLTREDFEPMIQDIVESFPGLYFLREAPDFHSRYVQTVIARIFFTLNRSWSGRITLSELRRSNFLKVNLRGLEVVRSLETVEDINSISEFFSYEHFYVIYCKFWEIDRDHDLFISKADLAKHENAALTPRIIERIFSGAVRPAGAPSDKMSYTEFVSFLIAEEDKKHPTSLEYWFRCLDLDGDGRLSMYELEYFYADIAKKMEDNSVDPMPFNNLLCEVLDIVKPACSDFVTLKDIRRSGMGTYFFNSFVNIHKHYDQESESDRTSLRSESGEEMSEWERYCAEEYEYLMAQEEREAETELHVESDEEAVSPLSSSAPEAALRPAKGSQPFPLDAL